MFFERKLSIEKRDSFDNHVKNHLENEDYKIITTNQHIEDKDNHVVNTNERIKLYKD